jgi:hypothetical protein
VYTTRYLESETHDRRSIDLPTVQHELASAIIALGKPTVLVLINGGSVALSETELNAPNVAVVEAFYPGTKGSEAIAGAIFAKGSASTSAQIDYVERYGRLPYSIYAASWVNASLMVRDIPMFCRRSDLNGCIVTAMC